MSLSSYLEVNGQLLPSNAAHVSALDRGYTLSDGLFETIRVVRGQPFRLEAHLSRLRRGASVLRLPLPWDDAELRSRIERVLAANALGDAVVRLTISRGVPSERGLLPPENPAPTVVVQAVPFHDLPPNRVAAGFRIVTSAIRRNEYSPTSRIKACNYLDNVLARIAAQDAGADESLLLNTKGHVACCTSANMFLVRRQALRTPALHCGVLAGITRDVVRELAVTLSLAWEEAELAVADVEAADEVFITNSVVGIVPVTVVDDRVVGGGVPGPVGVELRNAYRRHIDAE